MMSHHRIMVMIALSQLNIEMSCMVRHEQLTMMKGGLTMINMSEVISGVTLTKACSIKADKDSDSSKVINLKVKCDGATLQGVFDKALAGAVIQWQNGVGRKQFDTLKDKQTVEITFTSPAKTTVDPETAMVNKLANMTPEEQQAYIAELMLKAKK